MGYAVEPEGKCDGHTNMSRDAGLLERAEAGESAARIYQWHGPWVSLGRFQDPERDLLDPSLVPWVVRPTGGKAVLHGHDLTVSLARPIDSTNSRALRAEYRLLIAPLVRALDDLGLRAALGEETRFLTRGLKTADCFRHISPNDVIDPNTGRKLIGCAMRMTRRAVLAQCSIPVEMPLRDPARIYAHPHVGIPLGVGMAELRGAISATLESG
ncbi:MAG: lipoate--protein ligase family protein [Fimbriimonadales bacterium]